MHPRHGRSCQGPPPRRARADRRCPRASLSADLRSWLPASILPGYVPEARPLTVLIADDHRLMREGTAALLRADPRIEIVGMASNGREALALDRAAAPPMSSCLTSRCPCSEGSRRCATIRERHPGVEVLILTVSENEPDVWAALRMGAAGYLLKDMPPDRTDRDVARTPVAVSRHIAQRMAGRMLREFAGGDRTHQGDPLVELSPASARCSRCSPRAFAIARSPRGLSSPRRRSRPTSGTSWRSFGCETARRPPRSPLDTWPSNGDPRTIAPASASQRRTSDLN